MRNPLLELKAAGQSAWLDFIERRILSDGSLAARIARDGITGVTSNPAIFERALKSSDDYDPAIRALADQGVDDVKGVFERLAIEDLRAAADLFRDTWEASGRRDGFVSLEISPYLARDAAASIEEGLRLWRETDRPNLMIKVPGVAEGLPVIRALVSEGVNVNVTLLFSLEAYAAAALAHVEGLEAFRARGGDVSAVAGVASFFISRIDVEADRQIDAIAKTSPGAAVGGLRGRAAIASAKLAYAWWRDLVASPRWRALADAGASPQRLLWASTGVKDPAYRDVRYVEELIGPETVNTMPPATMDAFLDHGEVRATLETGVEAARADLDALAAAGVDLGAIASKLETDGVRLFEDAADGLMGAVADRRAAALGDRLGRHAARLPEPLDADVRARTEAARAAGMSRRLWARDKGLWTGADEDRWLGWLEAARGAAVDLPALEAFAARARSEGAWPVQLLGMGGSSLAPEVLARILAPGSDALAILDSTQPDAVLRVAAASPPATTRVFVSSKSGSTLEPDALLRLFWSRASEALGPDAAARRFAAVTDPGSALEATARERGFSDIFLGRPDIGGRYSALSNFGLAPAAAAGLDVGGLITEARRMAGACGPDVPPAANPGLSLGLILGACAVAGRDKLTLFASPRLAPFGAWLEQLVAESLGKEGRGVIPVADEPLLPARRYGADRVFVALALDGDGEPATAQELDALEAAGHPVVRIRIARPEQIAQEFVRWEIATAAAGAVIGVNPFDQPDVEASKVRARELTAARQAGRAAPAQTPLCADAAFEVYGAAATDESDPLRRILAHLGAARRGDYVGLLLWTDRTPEIEAGAQALRSAIAQRTGIATTVGFGPRFLHSTGQGFKGGPNTGVFLHLTADPAGDVDAPGLGSSFGEIAAAQAEGDFDVMRDRGRRILRVHMREGAAAGLARILQALGPAA